MQRMRLVLKDILQDESQQQRQADTRQLNITSLLCCPYTFVSDISFILFAKC